LAIFGTGGIFWGLGLHPLIACYCRVSTRHQKNDSQRAEIEQWLRNNQMDLSAVRWFEDKESATAPHRPAFEAMQAGIFDDTIKTVVIWKLDRLSRRLRDGMNLLADWCERGVRGVVAVTQQIDLSGTVGHMVASVMFGLAEIELEYRRGRQATGIAVAKRKGVYNDIM
jgi:DNA invertase Pin-like site-specific DNA recombinase